jgi:hypothetical protein
MTCKKVEPVMPGIQPGIHVSAKFVDGRDKPGHDKTG